MILHYRKQAIRNPLAFSKCLNAETFTRGEWLGGSVGKWEVGEVVGGNLAQYDRILIIQ